MSDLLIFWHHGEKCYVTQAEMDALTKEQAITDARTTYEEARAWLAILIDNPDKSVAVAEYRAQIKAAQKASRDAHDAWMGEA